MKVGIEARVLSSAGGGVKRYVKNLLKAIDEREDGNSYEVILDSSKVKKEDLKMDGQVVQRMGDIGLGWWLNRQVPKHVSKRGMDVVHFTKADVPRRIKTGVVVSIYDVIPLLFPQSQKPLAKVYWSTALRRAAQCSDQIITISETSKRDIVEKLEVKESRVTVTPMVVDKDKFHPGSGEKNKYLLYVGTVEPRKNVASLIRAFAKVKDQIPHKLVIVGRNYKGRKRLERLVSELEISDRVDWLDFVDEVELLRLYQEAELFIWPSIYEGWGFPPQEAMACGTPVIVSNGGSLPEVVGGAGEIVEFMEDNLNKRSDDQQFVDALSMKIIEIVNDPAKKKEMIARGLSQSGKNSWQSVVEVTVDVYEKVYRSL